MYVLKDLRKNPKWGAAAPGELANFGREFNGWLINEIKNAFRQGIKINDMELDFSTFHSTLID